MNTFLWIVAVLVAAVFFGAGVMKLIRPKESLADAGLKWTEDFNAGTIKLIGASEVLAALGLILPEATGIAPILTPLAAVGLVIVMVGAAVVHIRRQEWQMAAGNAFLLILAAFVAIGRFWIG